MSIQVMEFLQYVLTFAEVILCFFYLELFINGAEMDRGKLFRVILPSALVAALVAYNRNIVFFSFFMLPLQCILICFISKFFYKQEITKLLVLVTFYNTQVAFLDLAITLLVTKKRTGQEDILFYMHHLTMERVLTFFLCRLLLMLIYFCLLKNIRKKNILINIFTYINILLCISIGELVSIYYYMCMFLASESSTKISSWIGMLTIGIVACCLLWIYVKNRFEKQKSHILEMQNEILERNHQKIYRAALESSKEYHDFKNQLGIIYDYIKSERNNEALEYIEKIRKPILLLQEYSQTGNRALDLILSDKIKEANESGIEVSTYTDKIGNLFTDNFDLYSIMANILDNAIEACKLVKMDKRWIDIILTRKGEMTFIEVKNCLETVPIKSKNRFISTKKIQKNHGYGLRSVEMIAKKYNGFTDIKYDEGFFDITITLFTDRKC